MRGADGLTASSRGSLLMTVRAPSPMRGPAQAAAQPGAGTAAPRSVQLPPQHHSGGATASPPIRVASGSLLQAPGTPGSSARCVTPTPRGSWGGSSVNGGTPSAPQQLHGAAAAQAAQLAQLHGQAAARAAQAAQMHEMAAAAKAQSATAAAGVGQVSVTASLKRLQQRSTEVPVTVVHQQPTRMASHTIFGQPSNPVRGQVRQTSQGSVGVSRQSTEASLETSAQASMRAILQSPSARPPPSTSTPAASTLAGAAAGVSAGAAACAAVARGLGHAMDDAESSATPRGEHSPRPAAPSRAPSKAAGDDPQERSEAPAPEAAGDEVSRTLRAAIDSGDLGVLKEALAKAGEGDVSIDLMDRAHATKVDLEDEVWSGRMRRLASQALQEALGQDAPEWLSAAVERAREAGVHSDLVDSAREALRKQQARQEAEDALLASIQGAAREADATALQQAISRAEQLGACSDLLAHARRRVGQLDACVKKTQERLQAEQQLMELVTSAKDAAALPPALDAALQAGVCRRVLDSAWKKKTSLEAQTWQAQKRELACGSVAADEPFDVANLDTHTVLPSLGRSEDFAASGFVAPASLVPPQLASPCYPPRHEQPPMLAQPSLEAIEPAMGSRSCPPRPAMSLSRSGAEMDMPALRSKLQDDQQPTPRLTKQALEALDRPNSEQSAGAGGQHPAACASPLPELRDLGARRALPQLPVEPKVDVAAQSVHVEGGGSATGTTPSIGDADGAYAAAAGSSDNTPHVLTDTILGGGSAAATAALVAASERPGGAGPLPPAPVPTSPMWAGSQCERSHGAGGLPPKPSGRRSMSSTCQTPEALAADQDLDATFGAQSERTQQSARSNAGAKEELPSYGLDAELKARAAAKYDPRIEHEAAKWIEALTGTKVADDFYTALRTGEVLCQLVNAIRPGMIQKINAPGSPFKERENISNFLRACRSLGVQEYALFSTDDLFEGTGLQSVAKCVHALGGSLCRSVPEFLGPHLGIADTSKAKRDHKRDLGVASQTGGFYGAMERSHLDLTSGQIVRGGC